MNGAGQILVRVPANAAVQAPRCSGPAAGASAAELRLDRSRLSRWYRPTSPCTGPHPRTSLLYLMIGVGVVIPIILSYQAYGYRVFRGGLNRHQEATAA